MKRVSSILSFLSLSLCLSQGLYAQLGEGGRPLSFRLNIKADPVPVEVMPGFDQANLSAEDAINDANKGPYRFGYNHLVNLNPLNKGAWITLSNGDRIWRLEIQSPRAQTINLAFNQYRLPPGAKLFIYDREHKQVLGAFTAMHNYADHEFGTDLITGEDIIVEYDEPASVRGLGYFNLFRVTHGYRAVEYAKSFAQAGACLKNARCPEGNSWSNQRRSVVCLVSGGNEFCSGSLINNVTNDGTPYILTANHCGTASGSWVFRFNWEAPGCANPGSSPSTLQSISGGIPVAHNAASDFDLCKMSAVPPASYQVFYAGWSNVNVPADSVCGIHHPSGDIKKISFAKNAVTAANWGGAAVWQIGQWTDGCTEPGSSGSPLFDQNRRIVGQLFGGPSSCTANPGQDFDYYGRFAVSWNNDTVAAGRLHDWLDPGNTGATLNNGYDPNGLFVNTIPGPQFTFFPNPSNGKITLGFEELLPGKVSVSVYDSQGRLVFDRPGLEPIGQRFVEVIMGDIAGGIYWITVNSGKGVSSRQLVIEREKH